MNIVIIAALSDNNVIGVNGHIPWHIGDDLKRFKRLTTGHTVIMGRKTFESIGRPLPGRTNIVLTRNTQFKAPDGVRVFSALDDALASCRQTGETTAYVIGGAEIYRESLPVADRLVLTHVRQHVQGDTFFPAYDKTQWREVAREDHDTYAYVEYERA
jgi:dihydrofolate reductase